MSKKSGRRISHRWPARRQRSEGMDTSSLDINERIWLFGIHSLHQLETAVVDLSAFRRFTLVSAVMSMAVKNRVHIEVIDRLGQTRRTEKRMNFRRLAGH